MNKNIKSLWVMLSIVAMTILTAFSMDIEEAREYKIMEMSVYDIVPEKGLEDDIEQLRQEQLEIRSKESQRVAEIERELKKELEEKLRLEQEAAKKLEEQRIAKLKEAEQVASRSKIRTSSVLDFKVTAYDLSYNSCNKAPDHPDYGVTASGFNLKGLSREAAMTVAADPRILPLGTKLKIEFPAGYEHFNGIYTVRDTGGAVKGYKIDLFMGDFGTYETNQSVWDFGVRYAKVEILN